VAGFSTHPHWDHLLWDVRFGDVPRYGTATAAATIRARLADPGFKAFVPRLIPPEIVDDVPLDLLGLIEGVPDGATHVPWDGPKVRIIEHQAHAAGHAALLIEDRGVLVAGDMLSDVLIPILNQNGAADPIGDYLTALDLLETATAGAEIVIPGHGSVGHDRNTRLDRDKNYVRALRDADSVSDPRIGPEATYDWMSGVHEQQWKTLKA
jgi:glyoxylase-like metal-dependent hydrolase (beta-lactamase superfamily II)